MKYCLTKLAGSLLFAAAMADAPANNLLISGQTERFTISGVDIVSQIPASSQRQWPEKLPVFKRKAGEFSVAGLQALIDQSCFAGTNVAALLKPAAHQGAERDVIRLRTPDRLDHVFVNFRQGRVLVDCGAERGGEIPPPDAVPALQIVTERAVRFAEMLGVPTGELERKEDGSFHMTVMETDQFQRGIKYKESRAVILSRSIAGHPVLSHTQDDDKIHLQLGVNGRFLKFDLHWTFLEPTRTNQVLRLPKVFDAIRQGNVVADIMNEYPADGITRIELKDFRVIYVVPTSPDGEIRPAVAFHAIFESKMGEKTEGGLFTPILDSE